MTPSLSSWRRLFHQGTVSWLAPPASITQHHRPNSTWLKRRGPTGRVWQTQPHQTTKGSLAWVCWMWLYEVRSWVCVVVDARYRQECGQFLTTAVFGVLGLCAAMAAPGSIVDLGVYDRFHVHAQMEHLQTKYHGTGHADTTKWEWATNIHRDTMASHVGHYTRLAYFALCENEPVARVRFNCLQVEGCHPRVGLVLLVG